MGRVFAHQLRNGDRIWLSPGHAGVPRTVDVAKPHPANDEDMAITFYPEGDLPGAYFRAGRAHQFDTADSR